MNRSRSWLWIGLLVILGTAAGVGKLILGKDPPETIPNSQPWPASVGDSSGYEQVTGPRGLIFPQDFGPHPNYLTEWWYYTGNLSDEAGRQFGYQLTFFRRALEPPDRRTLRGSHWAVEQVYMGHFTLTDVSNQRFTAFERFERGSAGLAGAQGAPAYQVWIQDWQVEQTGEHEYRLRAREVDVEINLILSDIKGIVLQGEEGYSQKGPERGNASIYYSQPRLRTEGTIAVEGKTFRVQGNSWLDREISTSALSPGLAGWDWFSLQLDDGSEMMAYILRREDGTVDRFSAGTLIRADGSAAHLKPSDFEITATATWQSPHSGGVYPAQWIIRVPQAEIELEIKPLLQDQELSLSFTYWEGAVEITGVKEGFPIHGRGYVELTGYVRSLGGGL